MLWTISLFQCSQSALIHLYAVSGKVKITCFVFDEMLEKGVISLNSKFAGYFNGGDWEEVALVFIAIAVTSIKKIKH